MLIALTVRDVVNALISQVGGVVVVVVAAGSVVVVAPATVVDVVDVVDEEAGAVAVVVVTAPAGGVYAAFPWMMNIAFSSCSALATNGDAPMWLHASETSRKSAPGVTKSAVHG